MAGFVVTYPLYLIVIGKRLQPLTAISEDDDTDELRGVALFSEQLFAERTRDEQAPDGKLWIIHDENDLRSNHLPLFKSWGFKHVSIDTHERTGRGWYIPIEDLEA